MSDDDLVFDLVEQWEAAWRAGVDLDARDLCSEHVELTSEVAKRIASLKAMNQLLDLRPSGMSVSAADSDGIDSHSAVSSLPRKVQTTSRYRVLRSHARGGLGEILIAIDEQLDRQVAIKVIQSPLEHEPTRRKRFFREAEITGRLEHPGIVPVHGVGEDIDGRPCYAMRFIEGETLQQAIESYHASRTKNSHFDNRLAFRVLLQRFVSVCNTVAYAHSRDVIHRDIKPGNIILGNFGETMLVDWGLAKRLAPAKRDEVEDQLDRTNEQLEGPPDAASLNSDDQLTRQGGVVGTPTYMSPEQASRTSLGTASDIYSLGATLYTLLCGQAPFAAKNVAATIEMVRLGRMITPRQVLDVVPPALEAICLKAMSNRPEDRYPSSIDSANDIEHWLADESVSVYRASMYDRFMRWSRRHRAVVTTGAIAGLLLLLSLSIQIAQVSHRNRLLRESNFREKMASTDAIEQSLRASANAKIADEQSALALSILQEVIQDIQRDLRNTPAAQSVRKAILQKSMSGLNRVAASIDRRPQLSRNMMLAHRDLSDAFMLIGTDNELGGSRAAEEQLLKAFEIAEQLDEMGMDRRQSKIDLAVIHRRLGTVTAQRSTAKETLNHLLRCLNVLEAVDAEYPGDEEIQSHLILALNSLGDYYIKNRTLSEAEKYHERALSLAMAALGRSEASDHESNDLEESASNHPLPHDARSVRLETIQRNFELSLNNVANLRMGQGRVAEAIELYERSLASCRQRSNRDVYDSSAQQDLAFVLSSLGRAHWDNGAFGQVEPYYQEALRIRKQRHENAPTNLQTVRERMQAHEKMGDLMVKLDRLQEAVTHYRAMLEFAQILTAADREDRSAIRDLSVA